MTVIGGILFAKADEDTSILGASFSFLFFSIFFVIHIILGVFFIRWFRRAYKNLARIGIYLKNNDDWAVWSWFIPIVNLWEPWKLMVEIWNKTKKVLVDSNLLSPSHHKVGIVNWWWALYITRWFGHLILADVSGLFHLILELVSTYAAIVLIKRYSLMEQLLYNHQDHLSITSSSQLDSSYQSRSVYSGRERDPYFRGKG